MSKDTKEITKKSHDSVKEVNIFDYQDEAIENLKLLDNKYKGNKKYRDFYSTLVVVPTGGGKTRIAVRYIYENVLNNPNNKVIWIGERLLLLDQAHDSFKKFAYSDNAWGTDTKTIVSRSISSKHEDFDKIDSDVKLLIITQQTFKKQITKYKNMYEKMREWINGTENLTVIIDEAHHAVAESYRLILDALERLHKNEAFSAYHVIGLTATPVADEGELDRIFRHGVLTDKNKNKFFSGNTNHAYSISINHLVATGVLSRPHLMRVDISDIAKQSDERKQFVDMNEKIISVYLGGVTGLEDIKKKSEGTEKEKEGGHYAEFGQTIIFVKSREQALDLVNRMEEKNVKCGLSITIDKSISKYFKGDNIDEFKIKANQVKQDVIDYKSGNLPVIISVNKLREGVDVPKTQTVFLADNDTKGNEKEYAREIATTQMVGRAMRGVKQGGTETAYIVCFGEQYFHNILWEMPDAYKKAKALKNIFQIPQNNKLDAVIINASDFEHETKITFTPEMKKQLIDVDDFQDTPSDGENSNTLKLFFESISRMEWKGELILPKGYYCCNKKKFLVWESTEIWMNYMRKEIEELSKKKEITGNVLKSYSSFEHIGNNILDESSGVLGASYKQGKGFVKALMSIYLYHFIFHYKETLECNEAEFMNQTEIIEFDYLEEDNYMSIVWKYFEEHDTEKDTYQYNTEKWENHVTFFLHQEWHENEGRLKKVWINKELFTNYLKVQILRLGQIPIEPETEDEDNGSYFRIRLYREGRKRESLCKLLKNILKSSVLELKEMEFVDVFGGTGTVTAHMSDLFKKSWYNEFDLNLVNFVYCVSEFPDFDNYCAAQVRELFKIKNTFNKIGSEMIQIHAEQQELGFFKDKRTGIGYDLESYLNEIIKKKLDNIKERTDEKKNDINENLRNNAKKMFDGNPSAENNYERTVTISRKAYLLRRYKELVIMKKLLEDEAVNLTVKMFILKYRQWEHQLNNKEDFVKKLKSFIKSDNQDERMKAAFKFMFTRGFPSRQFAGDSITGVDPDGIKKFTKNLGVSGEGAENWLTEFHKRMEGVEVTSQDFTDVLRASDDGKERVYYLDPPYFLTKQYDEGFPDEFHLKMLKWFRETECKWILSCKDKATNKNSNIGMEKRKRNSCDRMIYTKKGYELYDYFKLFIYNEQEKDDYEKNERFICAGDECTEKNLYVYRIKDEKGSEVRGAKEAFEIMISNINIVKNCGRFYEKYERQEFKDFLVEYQ